jgi:hypothetical protein
VGVEIVDCMACLVAGVLTPVGFRDACGIVHRVRWSTRSGPYPLCDFDEDGKPRRGARTVQPDELVPVEEP